MLVDTHCHLTHDRFRPDLDEVLAAAAAAGTGVVVCVASDLDDAVDARRLAQDVEPGRMAPRIVHTAGVHPHQAGSAPGDLVTRLRDDLLEGAVAIGECGLDFHYDFSPREAQRRVFHAQLELAAETGLPVVVHCREAEAEMGEIVREAGSAGIRGVLHCFPGDLGLLEIALESGWFVSFTGMVTFGSFEGAEAVRRVPADRYMLETDGPYMAPAPHRGQRNEPAFISLVRDRIADLRGEAGTEVGQATTRNAGHFFGLQLT